MSEDADNVVILPGVTNQDIPPERVLRAALEEELTGVLVIGCDAEGNEYFASSLADGGEITWLLRRTEHKLMRAADMDMEDVE